MLVDRLKHSTAEEKVEILSILTDRNANVNTSVVDEYLSSNDAYIWFNAALLVGRNGGDQSIPYLIKGMNHAAFKSREEVKRTLISLTGRNFGDDFEQWKQWYLKDSAPPEGFDWSNFLSR